MTEFNIRTALNHQLRLDAEAVERRANRAKARKFARKLNKAYRQGVTTVAVDAALIGSIVTAAVVMVVCAII
jgi:hypothetical protein